STAASANLGLWQFDRRTSEWWATEHCRTLFGLPAGVPLTREMLLAAIHPEDRDTAVAALRDAASADRPAVRDVRAILPGGRMHWLRIRARSHPDDGGITDQLSGIIADITDQKAAEAEAALRREEVAHLM